MLVFKCAYSTNPQCIGDCCQGTTSQCDGYSLVEVEGQPDVQVVLCPSKESAKSWLAQNGQPHATVEAEYGSTVVLGSQVTLAHHAPDWEHEVPPCVAEVPEVVVGESGDLVVMISHLDLDSVGGILAVIGQKPADVSFWEGAALIDVRGPHHAHQLDLHTREKLQAYWAWNASRPREERITVATNVTDKVMEAAAVINRIVNHDLELLEAGRVWAEEVQAATEACLLQEDETVRVFRTDRVFCSASYYSPSNGTVAKATVTFNTKFDAITVAFEDGGKEFSARDLVQKLWGAAAGGHAGIAGSPRGTVMSEDDLWRAVDVVKSLYA